MNNEQGLTIFDFRSKHRNLFLTSLFLNRYSSPKANLHMERLVLKSIPIHRDTYYPLNGSVSKKYS